METRARSLRGATRRLALTIEHLGWRTALWRVVTFPLRFTPLRFAVGMGEEPGQQIHDARRWQRREAPPLTTIRPGDPLEAPAGHDLAVLDGEPDRSCLAVLQHTLHASGAAVAAGTVLAPDGTIAAAGLARAFADPAKLEGRFAGRPADHGPAQVLAPVTAASPQCAVIRADRVASGATVEEVSLAAWADGERVVHEPLATTRVNAPATPSAASTTPRTVRTPTDRLRVIYVTQETTVGGGHRDIFEHINRLTARGHDVSLFSLHGQPDWFDLDIEVRQFDDYDALTAALEPLDALKIATWWRTAEPVWLASRRRGFALFFVQDIETSYYPDAPRLQDEVLAGYRNEFRYMTISGWNRDRLRELGVDAELIPPGIDLDTFRPQRRERREDMLLAVGRSNHLKNLDLTIDAWRALGDGRPELTLFGIEPELGPKLGARYVERPSDEGVNELFNETTVFIQTSRHEGFALPPLEAMATGTAVVCTDAHGNRDFCEDGVNCLMPDPTPESVSAALQRLFADPHLRARLGEAGIRTAREYAWERRIDALEGFLLTAADMASAGA